MQTIINGIETSYQTFGEEGIPFLILHGWGSNSDRWADVSNILIEKGFKVIVPDLPGFGNTNQPITAWNTNNYINWIEGLVKELNIREFYLAGHSFGGALAVKYAIKHPQDVRKLFLISAASVRKKTVKKSAYKGFAHIFKFFGFLPGYKFFRKAVYKFIIGRSDYPYVDGLMKETFMNVIAEDLSQFTGFIKTPTIIIWGDKDKATLVEDAYFMENKIKNSKLVIIEGAGHILNRECPEVLAEKILNNV